MAAQPEGGQAGACRGLEALHIAMVPETMGTQLIPWSGFMSTQTPTSASHHYGVALETLLVSQICPKNKAGTLYQCSKSLIHGQVAFHFASKCTDLTSFSEKMVVPHSWEAICIEEQLYSRDLDHVPMTLPCFSHNTHLVSIYAAQLNIQHLMEITIYFQCTLMYLHILIENKVCLSLTRSKAMKLCVAG